MPKLAIAVVVLALVALSGSITYAGYLVVGVLAEYSGISRFLAGFFLGALFARIPWIRHRKLRTIGLLPKALRKPVILALLSFALLHFARQGELLPMFFLAFAAGFLLGYRWIRRAILGRVFAALFKTPAPGSAARTDGSVIDVEFHEKKD